MSAHDAFENTIARSLSRTRLAATPNTAQLTGPAMESVALTAALALVLRDELSPEEFGACYSPLEDVILLATIELTTATDA